MKIRSIASSSSGNCTYITDGEKGLLIDAGGPKLSMKKLFEAIGDVPIDAIFITHEHGDHMGVAGPLARKLNIPVYIHADSYKKYEHDEWFEKFAYEKEADLWDRKPKFNNCRVEYLDPTRSYNVGNIQLTPFSTPHDAAYSVGFIVEDTETKKKLGYLTDCGSFTKIMELAMKGCDAYMIEADYDEEMLWAFEEYDEFLKERIASNVGHLSNDQTMKFLEKIGIDSTEFVMFCHLSPRTNTPEKVLEAAEKYFPAHSKFLIAPHEEYLEL